MSDQPNKNSKFRVVLFALLVSLICSFLITAAAVGLKDRQMVNMALDKRVNILKAASLIEGKKPAKDKINALYESHIQEVLVNSQGEIIQTPISDCLTLFLIKTDSGINGYILPITTRGLWGKIHGYLAFENDGQTISGFSVFSHSETPGLGGEIESAWFQKNFKGKKIVNSQNQFVSVGIAKGKAENLSKDLQANYVDGISGATLTGKYLSQGIKQSLAKTNPVTVKFIQRQLTAKAPVSSENKHKPPIIKTPKEGE
jgi:Na+-transporting NADH:ubiquinone oxidoreductase subunit C